MPATATKTYSCKKLEPTSMPEDARQIAVALEPAGAGLTVELARGIVLGEVTATGKFAAYTDGNVDGTGEARALLMYDISVDDAGNITLTDTASEAQDRGETYDNVPIWVAGNFKTTDLTGLDAAAVADLGRIISGSVADGILRIG